ncbi:MAG: hypothetical protein ACKVS5_08510 [Parvularculaceae bacterium]
MIALPILAGVGLVLAAEQLAIEPLTAPRAPFAGAQGELEMQPSTAQGTGRACAWGSADCNPCLMDVAGSVRSLRNRGDILGFFRGPAPDPTNLKHWQGIQRLMGLNANTLIVSSSNADEAGVATVEMASRNKSGLRFRSNRLGPRGVQDTPPPDHDKIIRYLRLDRTYKHASGFQTVGMSVIK